MSVQQPVFDSTACGLDAAILDDGCAVVEGGTLVEDGTQHLEVDRTVHGRTSADDLRKVGVPFQHDERAGLGLRKALCRVADGDDGAAPRALEAGVETILYMDRRNTDMKNKIKKILLLGMTAMFTAGAAGTAVISCPVWADEAEQNSETAEEPKAEDAAVEEEIADQTDDKTENTDLKTVEHPRMSVYSIRRFSIVKGGEEVFQIKQEPADYKMDFDYWEITNPYDEIATVNTENMYEMFGVLAAFDLSNGVDAANTDTGLDNTKTYFTVDFVNTVNDDTAKETQDADATATILIGNTDENGDYYACVKGYEEAVYLLSKESVNSLLELKPFNLILKIPFMAVRSSITSLQHRP